jgi:hypothetical protein
MRWRTLQRQSTYSTQQRSVNIVTPALAVEQNEFYLVDLQKN